MCLGIPAKVIRIAGTDATVVIGTVEYTASLLLLQETKIGDYVILHAGFAIERVDPEEAEETIRLFREISNQEEE